MWMGVIGYSQEEEKYAQELAGVLALWGDFGLAGELVEGFHGAMGGAWIWLDIL